MSQDTSPNDNMLRYYWIAALNGRIYIQASGSSNSNGVDFPIRSTIDGVNWTTGSSERLCLGENSNGDGGIPATVVFAGKIVCNNSIKGGVSTYDGATVTNTNPFGINSTLTDLYVDGSTLYALSDKRIYATKDLVSWKVIADTSSTVMQSDASNFTSLAIRNDYIYLGDTEAGIWKSSTTMTQSPAARIPSTSAKIAARYPVDSGVYEAGTYSCYDTDPGATATIGGKPTTIRYLDGQNCETGGYIAFIVDTGKFSPGVYEIQVTNPDGNTGIFGSITIYDPNKKPIITKVISSTDKSTGEVLLQVTANNFNAPNSASDFNVQSVWTETALAGVKFVTLNGESVPACTSQATYDWLINFNPSYSTRLSVDAPCYELGDFDLTTRSFTSKMTATDFVIRLPAGSDVSKGTVQWMGDGQLGNFAASQLFSFQDSPTTTIPIQPGQSESAQSPLADTGMDLRFYTFIGAVLIVGGLMIVQICRFRSSSP